MVSLSRGNSSLAMAIRYAVEGFLLFGCPSLPLEADPVIISLLLSVHGGCFYGYCLSMALVTPVGASYIG